MEGNSNIYGILTLTKSAIPFPYMGSHSFEIFLWWYVQFQICINIENISFALDVGSSFVTDGEFEYKWHFDID